MLGINENTLELYAISELEKSGWTHTHGQQLPEDWRAGTSEVIFGSHIHHAISRLNPQLPSDKVEVIAGEVLRQIRQFDNADLAHKNRRFYDLLKNGVPVSFTHEGEQRSEFVRLIDFQTVANNRFDVINQLVIKGKRQNRKPDILLYVNGLPLVIMELKNPFNASVSITEAYQQLQTYQDDIADVFIYNQLQIISEGNLARVGSLTADFERFSPWRVVDESVHRQLDFEMEIDALLCHLLNPATLLDHVQNFIVFEQDGTGGIAKKCGIYHQYYAVNQAIQCTKRATTTDGKIGVVWHTQGSGKSLSMLFYAGRVLATPEFANPTLVIVTDRNDLDGQLFATFSSGQDLLRQTPIQADGRDELRDELARRQAGGVIFTTIQKFGLVDGEDQHPILNDRHNIIVITDEAHRSQYGFNQKLVDGKYKTGYAKHLRDALPNASFIGFTGTPIALDDKDTQAVFGDYVSIYDITDAVKDGATVPIIYEARQIRLDKSQDYEKIIAQIQAQEAGSEGNLKAVRLRESLMGTEARLTELATDLVHHFENRIRQTDGKAMVVALSREICVKLYDKIVSLRPDWHSDEVDKGSIKIIMTGSAADGKHLQKHIYGHQDKKQLEKRFKDPNDPLKIVIVRDMWLTGFDAPCCHTMYIDKPMSGHNLMQAIARVNRVFRNKSRENGGLIVDYIGLTEELKEATARYSKDGGKGVVKTDIDEVFNKMLTFIDIIRGQFATPVDGRSFDLQAALTLDNPNDIITAVMRGANHIVSLDRLDKDTPNARKNAFLQAIRYAKKGYSLCASMVQVKAYQKELAFFDAVRAVIVKNSTTPKAVEIGNLLGLLDGAIASSGVMDLFDLLGQDKPNIAILSEEFLSHIKDSDHKELWALAVEKYLKRQIKEQTRTNISLQHDFATKLDETMNSYHNHQLSVLEVLEMLVAIGKELSERLKLGEQLGLTQSEIAFYDALAQNKSAIEQLGDEVLKVMAIEITRQLRASVTLDWSQKEAVRAKLRLSVRRILARFKYPPDRADEAVDLVLAQAEVMADELTQ